MIFDIFSKRNKPHSSLAFVYDNFKVPFKNQFIHFLHTYIGERYKHPFNTASCYYDQKTSYETWIYVVSQQFPQPEAPVIAPLGLPVGEAGAAAARRSGTWDWAGIILGYSHGALMGHLTSIIALLWHLSMTFDNTTAFKLAFDPSRPRNGWNHCHIDSICEN